MGKLIQIPATALVYAFLGFLGLTLAISPGYASPIFPAAGLAIAFALQFGNHILFGITLGSFAINLIVALQSGDFSSAGMATALGVAIGATVQTWCARTLIIRRQGNRWSILETEKDIALFLAVAGPLSCLISATIGTTTLFVSGILSHQELFYSWATWWIGDTLGVLIFTPLTLSFLLRAQPSWTNRQSSVAVPMLLALSLVVSIFFGVAHWEREELNNQISDYGSRIAQLIDHRLVAHQEAISSLRKLIEVTPDMTFQQFEYFTRITLKDNRDIFALSFNPYIVHSDRQAFEQSMVRKSPEADFMITERNKDQKLIRAAARPYYVAVGYIAPLEGNRPAIGFDINSEPVRRNAIDRALKSGSPAVTAPIRLVQENQERIGILVLHPAYGKHTHATNAGTSVTGFAVGVIKIDELIQIALRGKIQEGIILRIEDPLARPGASTLYQSDNVRATPVKSSFAWQTQLFMADRQWTLEIFPTSEYLRKQRSWLSWGVGIVGLFLAPLLQVLLLSMTGRTAVIRRQVIEQTMALTQAKDAAEASEKAKAESEEKVRLLLNSTAEGIYGIDLQGNCTFANPSCMVMLGYSDMAQLVGKNMHDLVHRYYPDGTPMPEVSCHIYQAFREGRGIHRDDEVFWRADGTSFPIEYWSHPQSINGVIIGAVVTFNDITERKRASEQLALKGKQLLALNQELQQRVDTTVSELRQKDQVLISQGRQAAMGDMIGNIAHQWRQPLNALSMLIANLQFAMRDNELTAERLDESANTANRLIQKMSTTINDFRNFFSPDKDIVAFSALNQIRQAVALVEDSFKNNNITIEIRTENDCILKGFPNEYSQVLLNLLGNAKDAILESGSTPGHIVIALSKHAGKGTVTVSDNGGGIPEKIRDKIFEPYFSTKSMGTGIGLYMSKMIIERNMHGIIAAYPVAGGTEFRVSIPLMEETE